MNATANVQEVPVASVSPQVLVCVKSPLMAKLVRFRAAVPVFVRVTVCVAVLSPALVSGKVNEVGERVAIGAIALPESETVRGLPFALSVIVREPVRVPLAVGLNVIEKAQLDDGASVAPQVEVFWKSPLIVTPVMLSDALPALDSVTVCAALAVPTVCVANVRLVVEIETTAAVPVPESAIDCGDPTALSVTVRVPGMLVPLLGAKVTEMEQLAPAANEAPQVVVEE